MFKDQDFKDDITSKSIMNNDMLLIIAPSIPPVSLHPPL